MRKLGGVVLFLLIAVLMVSQTALAISPPLGRNKYKRKVVHDSKGNAIVSGFHDGGTAQDWDYLIIKYNTSGTRLWSRVYNSRYNGVDEITAITVDEDNNVYVTGYSDGSRTNDYDYATIKYDEDGSQLWVKRYNGSGNGDDVPSAIAVDARENVYVTGRSDGGRASDYDYATIKYDQDGNEQWVKRYNGPANGADVPNAIGIDGNRGMVYVTGYSDGGLSHDYDFATIKYDSSGNERWAARFDGPVQGDDQANAMVVDSAGSAFVTGKMDAGRANDYDYMTIMYDVDGRIRWQAQYSGPGKGDDVPTAITKAGANIYVTGYVDGGRAADYDYGTIKYDDDGKEKWVERYNGDASGDDRAYSITTDAHQNVYVTGFSDNGATLTRYDFATVKYSERGSRRWVARYDGSAHGEDRGQSVSVYKSKIVYVVGRSPGASAGEDYALQRLDGDSGAQDWVQLYGR